MTEKNVDKKRLYPYTDLSKLNVGDHQVNFYGVILDATFPHKSFKSSRFICTLKIADPTSPIDKDGVCQSVPVVLFANKFDDLPVCQRVGEIVRIHRASVTQFKGKVQLTVNICFNSSWVLFPAVLSADSKRSKAREGEPCAFFGKSMHTTMPEIEKIRAYRKWTAKAFQQHPMLTKTYITPLARVQNKYGEPDENTKKYYDFDLQVKVVQLFKIDEYQSEMRCMDESGEIWHSQPYNAKYRALQEGQYVRIRAANLISHSTDYKRTFGMRPYTNILSLPEPCKLAETMHFDELEECKAFESQELIKGQDSVLRHPIIASKITDAKLGKETVTQLIQIDPKSSHLYKVRVNVAHAVNHGVKIYNKVNKEIIDLPKSGSAPAKMAKDQVLVTCVQLLVKDSSVLTKPQFAKLLLLDQGKFFGSSCMPAQLCPGKANAQTKKATQNVQEALDQLKRFNVVLEAGVQMTGNQLVISDSTVLKQYE